MINAQEMLDHITRYEPNPKVGAKSQEAYERVKAECDQAKLLGSMRLPLVVDEQIMSLAQKSADRHCEEGWLFGHISIVVRAYELGGMENV